MTDRPTLVGSPWDALRAVGENVGDGAEFIRDQAGEASTALGRSVRAATRSMCASVSRGANWVLDLSPGGFQGTVDLCSPFWEDNNSGPPSLESDPPEFTGGQCPGVAYTVTWSITETLCSSGPVNRPQPSQTVIGPVARARTEINPGSNPTVEFRFGTAGGTLPIQGSGSYVSPCFADVTSALDWGNFTVTRQDGLPDDCGNPPSPPPVLTPNPNPLPDPGYGPGEEPYADPSGKPVIPLPPISDPFGRPINLPDIRLPDLGDPLPFGDESGPGGPGVAGDPVDTGVGDEAEGSEPGKVLVGVQVSLTQIPSYARVVETSRENFYIGACYVYLGLPGRLDLQEEGRFIKDPQFFYAPVPADSWRVVAAPGYRFTVTPYYVQETKLI